MRQQTAATISQSDLEQAILRVLGQQLGQQLGMLRPDPPAASARDDADVEYSTMRRIAQRFDISRPTQYVLLGTGEIEAVKSGGRTLIIVASVRRYLARCPRAVIAPPRPRKSPQAAPAPAASDTRRADRRRIRQAGDGAGVPAPT
jgi:hypothetical protein